MTNFPTTKGKMISMLKQAGVRTGNKDGSSVKLEHLKTHQIITMFSETFPCPTCTSCHCK